MSAFESSPVHCLNPRPSGKRRKLGNEGVAAILGGTNQRSHINKRSIPSINVCENLLCLTLAVMSLNVFLHPVDEMILECPLDNLMEDIRGQEFMDISAGKAICEWLC
jgi:hypothetical protein